MGCTLIKSADETTLGSAFIGLGSSPGSRQAGGLGQQKCFEIEEQVQFSAPGMDQLTGMGQAGDWEHGEQLHRKGCGGCGGQQAEHEPEVHPSK